MILERCSLWLLIIYIDKYWNWKNIGSSSRNSLKISDACVLVSISTYCNMSTRDQDKAPPMFALLISVCADPLSNSSSKQIPDLNISFGPPGPARHPPSSSFYFLFWHNELVRHSEGGAVSLPRQQSGSCLDTSQCPNHGKHSHNVRSSLLLLRCSHRNQDTGRKLHNSVKMFKTILLSWVISHDIGYYLESKSSLLGHRLVCNAWYGRHVSMAVTLVTVSLISPAGACTLLPRPPPRPRSTSGLGCAGARQCSATSMVSRVRCRAATSVHTCRDRERLSMCFRFP